MELGSAVINSDYEFVSCLLYTTLSRVKRSEDVQLRYFSKGHVKSREVEMEKIEGIQSMSPDRILSCCKRICVTGTEFLSEEAIDSKEISTSAGLEDIKNCSDNLLDEVGTEAEITLEDYLQAIEVVYIVASTSDQALTSE